MKPLSRLCVASLIGAATWLSVAPAEAISVVRVTRRGYILSDEPDAPLYEGVLPVTNTRETVSFIQEVTRLLRDTEGFRPGQYLATMQLPVTQDPLAFYLPIRNDVRGIGQRSQADSRSETYDNNRLYGTEFPLDGFLYLNSLRYYTDPRAVNYGRYLICTQEFGHRFGATSNIGPFPGNSAAPDAGAPDASTVTPDAGGLDASVDGGAGPQPLARDALLGRGNRTTTGMVVNRAHWSYFFHSGGSPMEGNNWVELAPGMFQTGRPTFRFSDLDLYNMGLIPPTAVRPSFLIAEPQGLPRNVTRDSGPEFYNRTVTITGRRVDVTIDDIVSANGPRMPAYPDAPRDMNVIWVLLVSTPDDVDDQLAAEFDEAIDSCSLGYSSASNNLGHLIATVPEMPDAGEVDAGEKAPDAADDVSEDVTPEAAVADAGRDASDASADAPSVPSMAGGGCHCRAAPGASRGSPWAFALCVAGVAAARRRRARGRASVVRSRG